MAKQYHLVIVESPAKAKTIKRFLGPKFRVEASMGHVRDLPKSQMGVEIDNDFQPKYITIRGKGELLDKIRKDAQGADRVYLATDPDREGEAISWHLAQILKLPPGEACRISFNEITKTAVKAAIKEPRPINLPLVDAQQARRVLDRLVGYQISPLLWRKVRKGLSAGRVQSVATRIICDREWAIREFESREYWTLHAGFVENKTAFEARYQTADGRREFDAAESETLRASLEKAQFAVTQVKSGERRKNAPPPFTTSSLQQEASRKLGFTTRKTMMIAQQLYEGVDVAGEGTVGLVTYIRTDSVRISDEAIASARAHIAEVYSAEYVPETPNTFKGRKGAQDAHEAIRPSALMHSPATLKESLSRDQYRLYKMIYERFLASQMTQAVFETMAVVLSAEPDTGTFRVTGSRLKFPGFMIAYIEGREENEEDEDQDVKLPVLTQGQRVELKQLDARQHFTQPPPRYTEASLVRVMEEKGIGRPSTYAPIIHTILSRDYVVREGKTLMPTELGDIVTELMKSHFEKVVDVQFTADMEEKLDGVEDGVVAWKDIIRDFYGPFAVTLARADELIEKVEIQDEVSDIPCDKCGAMMVYKIGRYGRFLACPRYPECKNARPVIESLDGVPCPKCGAAVTHRRTRKGSRSFYGCSKYPDCDFISWDRPVAEKCPDCGGYMVFKQDRKGHAWRLCANPECACRQDIEVSEADEMQGADSRQAVMMLPNNLGELEET